MLKRPPSRKAKIRKLTNQLLENIVDICLELDREDCNFDYIIDFIDQAKDDLYDMKGLCYRRSYDSRSED